jgi:Ca-activated chloride channel family protein
VLRLINRKLGPTRIFAVGVGGAVNRYLLEQIAKIGRGAVAFVGLGDARNGGAVADLFEQIARPALTNVTLDFCISCTSSG